MSVRFHESVMHLLVDIDGVRQHPRNPNNGDVEAIEESILTNGFYNPVIAQESTGHILAGNHRYAALLALGSKVIPVVWVDVSDEDALRIVIADNRTAELAVRDEHSVSDLLHMLEETEGGLLGTAYDDAALIALDRKLQALDHMTLDPEMPEPDLDPDVVPHVTVRGYVDDDGHVRKFDKGEVMDAVARLRDLGFHAVGGL